MFLIKSGRKIGFTLAEGATHAVQNDNNNVILSRSEGSHNIEILRLLRSLRMTVGKGVNVFSLSKGEGQGEGLITNLRKELINLSTYPPINFKKTGFTLSEVLITLGIIGVVAAITIPTLMSKIQSIKFYKMKLY